MVRKGGKLFFLFKCWNSWRTSVSQRMINKEMRYTSNVLKYIVSSVKVSKENMTYRFVEKHSREVRPCGENNIMWLCVEMNEET